LPFLARPLLTTINVPREKLGRVAFEALDKMLRLKRHKGAEYYLETSLVVRKSTAPARQGKLRVEPQTHGFRAAD
jgi:DNA-binding LacI/PurR family transcriptional regulator